MVLRRALWRRAGRWSSIVDQGWPARQGQLNWVGASARRYTGGSELEVKDKSPWRGRPLQSGQEEEHGSTKKCRDWRSTKKVHWETNTKRMLRQVKHEKSAGRKLKDMLLPTFLVIVLCDKLFKLNDGRAKRKVHMLAGRSRGTLDHGHVTRSPTISSQFQIVISSSSCFIITIYLSASRNPWACNSARGKLIQRSII